MKQLVRFDSILIQFHILCSLLFLYPPILTSRCYLHTPKPHRHLILIEKGKIDIMKFCAQDLWRLNWRVHWKTLVITIYVLFLTLGNCSTIAFLGTSCKILKYLRIRWIWCQVQESWINSHILKLIIPFYSDIYNTHMCTYRDNRIY